MADKKHVKAALDEAHELASAAPGAAIHKVIEVIRSIVGISHEENADPAAEPEHESGKKKGDKK